MSQDGKVKNARYDKFKQLNRFLEFIEDVLPKLPKDREVQNLLILGVESLTLPLPCTII